MTALSTAGTTGFLVTIKYVLYSKIPDNVVIIFPRTDESQMLEISKASQITNTYHPSPYQTVTTTAQAHEPYESQAVPIHRSKRSSPITLCHPV